MARLISSMVALVISGSLLAAIGDPCKSNDDCRVREKCVTEFNQGYCVSYNCSAKNTCSGDSKCKTIEPENITMCLKACTQKSDCRTGYQCYEEVCLPNKL